MALSFLAAHGWPWKLSLPQKSLGPAQKNFWSNYSLPQKYPPQHNFERKKKGVERSSAIFEQNFPAPPPPNYERNFSNFGGNRANLARCFKNWYFFWQIHSRKIDFPKSTKQVCGRCLPTEFSPLTKPMKTWWDHKETWAGHLETNMGQRMTALKNSLQNQCSGPETFKCT